VKEELVQYTLLGIEVLEFKLPADNKHDDAEIDDMAWHYACHINYTPFSKEQIIINMNYSCFMYLKDDPARNKITSINTSTSFSVTASLSSDAKQIILKNFLQISIANLQGVYAAKTENTHWALLLPPQHDVTEGDGGDWFENEIYERWK